MIVVSDTTSITNVWQIEKLELLKSLYQKIMIPKAVWEELAEISAQSAYINQQDWILVQIAMINTQKLNQDDKILYGAYTIGRFWFFVILDKKTMR